MVPPQATAEGLKEYRHIISVAPLATQHIERPHTGISLDFLITKGFLRNQNLMALIVKRQERNMFEEPPANNNLLILRIPYAANMPFFMTPEWVQQQKARLRGKDPRVLTATYIPYGAGDPASHMVIRNLSQLLQTGKVNLSILLGTLKDREPTIRKVAESQGLMYRHNRSQTATDPGITAWTAQSHEEALVQRHLVLKQTTLLFTPSPNEQTTLPLPTVVTGPGRNANESYNLHIGMGDGYLWYTPTQGWPESLLTEWIDNPWPSQLYHMGNEAITHNTSSHMDEKFRLYLQGLVAGTSPCE